MVVVGEGLPVSGVLPALVVACTGGIRPNNNTIDSSIIAAQNIITKYFETFAHNVFPQRNFCREGVNRVPA